MFFFTVVHERNGEKNQLATKTEYVSKYLTR